MTTADRARDTQRLTAIGVAWLWHRRGARVIADEIGVHHLGTGFSASGGAFYRADLGGVAREKYGWRVDLVEVKGSRADARREEMGAGKWTLLAEACQYNLWLLVADEVRDEDVRELPRRWGLLRASPLAPARVKVVRQPIGYVASGMVGQEAGAEALFWLAQRASTSRLPWMGKSLSESVSRLVEAGEVHEET